eukprot:3669927-Rhodomonas_salina.2
MNIGFVDPDFAQASPGNGYLPPTILRTRYTMPGTDASYLLRTSSANHASYLLRTRYTMPGTPMYDIV